MNFKTKLSQKIQEILSIILLIILEDNKKIIKYFGVLNFFANLIKYMNQM